MPDKILGLDIGDSSVKAVQVTGGLKGSHVTGCACVVIDPDKGLEDALKVLFDEVLPFDNGICNTSFQADRVSFRHLSMPFKDKKKISRTIAYELEPMLPFPVQGMATDYLVMEHSGESRILSASIQQEVLSGHLASLASHLIDPDVIDLSGVPTAVQLTKDQDGPSDALFIDMGSKISSIVLCAGHRVTLVRSISVGGDTITGAIAESEEITFEEAEKLKCQGAVNGFAEIVQSVMESFSRDVRNTLHSFRHQTGEEVNPEKVFLTGGAAVYPKMPAMLEECLGLPVELVDLAKKQGLDMAEGAVEAWNPVVMNAALALALRDAKSSDNFNFRVGEFRKQKRYDQYKADIKRVALYVGAIFLVFAAGFFADFYVVKKRHDHLQQEIQAIFKRTFPGVERIVDPAHQMKVAVREAKESTFLPADALAEGMVLDVLEDITVRIPETADVNVSTLIIDDDRARLKGDTDNFNTVDVVKSALQKSEYFKDVSIGSAQQDRTGNRVRFELVMGRK
ncbi:MAG: pilus assembly protein PilM [Thermodesulfobacteriota bacterium]|nr:pilus assembly protein PilM [Thermodesulfobacteriota bacterium]